MELDRLFQEHHDDLFRYLARYTGDPDLAEDAAQEAFVRLAENPPSDRSHLRGWLYRVATNVARDARRTQRRREAILRQRPQRIPTGRAAPDPARLAEHQDVRRRVQAALAQLTERERTILLMREEGFTHREIAAAVETTTGSIGTMVARALEKLAGQLELDREEDA